MIKRSTVLFIFIILMTMSFPYWITRPLNNKISKGEIHDRIAEEEARRSRFHFGDIHQVVAKGINIGFTIDASLASTNELIMDTNIAKHVRLEVKNHILYINCDSADYFKKPSYNIHRYSDEVEAVDYNTNIHENNTPKYSTQFNINLNLKHFESIELQNVNFNLNTDHINYISYPIIALLDNSTFKIDYSEEIFNDSTHENKYLTKDLPYTIKVIQKNNSNFEILNYKNLNVEMRLINSYMSFPKYRNDYKALKISYDKYSDINLNITDLNWIKLEKTN